jgi:hypothetical protein
MTDFLNLIVMKFKRWWKKQSNVGLETSDVECEGKTYPVLVGYTFKSRFCHKCGDWATVFISSKRTNDPVFLKKESVFQK